MPDEIIRACLGGGAQTSGYPVDQPRAPLAQLGPLGIWCWLTVGRSWFAPVGMQMMDNEEGRALQSLGGLGPEWSFIISAVFPWTQEVT